jgi:hypothetical protein
MLRTEHLKEYTLFRLFNLGYYNTQKTYLRSVKF